MLGICEGHRHAAWSGPFHLPAGPGLPAAIVLTPTLHILPWRADLCPSRPRWPCWGTECFQPEKLQTQASSTDTQATLPLAIAKSTSEKGLPSQENNPLSCCAEVGTLGSGVCVPSLSASVCHQGHMSCMLVCGHLSHVRKPCTFLLQPGGTQSGWPTRDLPG